MLDRLGGRFAAWDYRVSTEAAAKRDVRIDLLRGFCVFMMIVDHVGGETSWLYVFTGGNHFIISAAEGFLFLSGFSMGMVHHVVIHRHGIRAMLEKVVNRAWLLYTLTVVLTLAFAAVSSVLDTPWSAQATPASSRADFALGVITLHRAYSLTDILVLYTLLVLSAGPALWLIARGYTRIVLAASIVAWVVAQVWPERVIRAWEITDGGFPYSSWQLMFFAGLVIGYHRVRLARFLTPRYLVAAGLAFAAALFIIEALTLDDLAFRFGGGSAELHDLLFDKNDARLGRVLGLLTIAPLAYAFATVAWHPLRRVTGWLLLPMGQRALFAYAVQLFVVAFASSGLMAPVRLDRENALFQGGAVLIVWLACLAEPAVMGRARSLASRLRPARSG